MKTAIGTGNLLFSQIAEITGGKTISTFTTDAATVSHIATDSRECDADTMFAALRGERVDGHDYMISAAGQGCRFFLCERMPSDFPAPFAAVLVDDTEKAIGKIARRYYSDLGKKTVGVTGSVGKTTTKEMISAVLGSRFRVRKTAGNHNSTLGMPMSLLGTEQRDEVSVVEMGMSALGEIEYMSDIARPDIACITNIGSSHLEALGTRENICRAKLEIVHGLRAGGTLILSGDEPLLCPLRGVKVGHCYVALENREADYFADHLRMADGETLFDLKTPYGMWRDVRVPGIGKPTVYAAMFAVAVGILSGIPEEGIRDGLMNFRAVAMRQNISDLGGITIIEDCYNASPESMRAAAELLSFLGKERGGRTVALLGDMRELGTDSARLHESVGSMFAASGLGLLFTVGTLAADIARGAAKAGMEGKNVCVCLDPEDRETVATLVNERLHPGDVLLVKASRAIGAEKILGLIKEKRGFGEGKGKTEC